MTNTDLQSINEEIAGNISRQVSAQVETTISDEVERGVEAARRGKKLVKDADGNTQEKPIFSTGFDLLDKIISGLIGALFRFLEAVGLDKKVAGWMGNPIPDQQEIKSVSSVVGQSVGSFIENSKSPDKESFERDMAAQIRQNLFAPENRSRYASLTDEQLNDIVNRTASETTQRLSGIFDENGKVRNDGQNPIVAAAQGQAYQEMTTALADPVQRKRFAEAIGKDEIAASDIHVFASVIGPSMAVFETTKPASAQVVAQRIYEDLTRNKPYIETATGSRLTSNMLQAASYEIADRYARSNNIPIDQEFRANMARSMTVATGDVIARKANDMANYSIAERTAIGVRVAYDNSSYVSQNNTVAYEKSDIRIFDKYYDKTSDPNEPYKRNSLPDTNGELAATIERMNRFASVGNNIPLTGNRALNEKQRELVSQIIGETTASTVTNAERPFANQRELAAALQTNVRDALTRRITEINALGTPIATINANLSDTNKPFDLIASIAGSIGDTMQSSETRETFAQIQQTQQMILERRNNAAMASAQNAGVSGNGITGGAAASRVASQPGVGSGETRIAAR